MKNKLLFAANDLSSINVLLKTGLIGYSTNIVLNHGVSMIYLYIISGEVIKIYSQMHDLGNWDKIGTLIFEIVEPVITENIIALPEEWKEICSIEKLIFEGGEFEAESGVVFKTNKNGILLIVAAANPYSLALQAPGFIGKFLPENDLSSYKNIVLE